jgi:CRP-like cAMP-binding protein
MQGPPPEWIVEVTKAANKVDDWDDRGDTEHQAIVKTIAPQIKSHPLFAGLDNEVFNELVFACRPRMRVAKYVIVKEGDPAAMGVIIVHGLVQVFRKERPSQNLLRANSAFMAYRGGGAHVGVQTTVLGEDHYYTTQTCIPCYLLEIRAGPLWQAHESSPRFALNLLRAYSDRQRDETETHGVLQRLSHRNRVAFTLLMIAHALGDPNAQKLDYRKPDRYTTSERPPHDISWLRLSHLCQQLPIDPTTLRKTLGDLERRKAITLTPRNPEAMKSWVDIKITNLQPLRQDVAENLGIYVP